MIQIHNPAQTELSKLNRIGQCTILDLISQGYSLSNSAQEKTSVLHVIIQNPAMLITMHNKEGVVSCMNWSLCYAEGSPDQSKSLIAASKQPVQHNTTLKGFNSVKIESSSTDLVKAEIASIFDINNQASYLSSVICQTLESVVSNIKNGISLSQKNIGVRYVLDESIKSLHPELNAQELHTASYRLQYSHEKQDFLVSPLITISPSEKFLTLDITASAQENVFKTKIHVETDTVEIEKFIEESIYSSIYNFFET